MRAQARERVGVQRVLGHVAAVGLLGHRLAPRPRGVGEGQRPPVAPADVVARELVELGEDRLGRRAFGG